MAAGLELEINQKVELEIKTGPYRGKYQSKIADIGNDTLKIMTPTHKGEILPIRKNLFLEVFYTDDDAAYRFFTRVLGRVKEPIPLLIAEIPSEVDRIQRRNYFRLEITKDVEYCRIDEEGEPLEEYKETKILDISGGGIKMNIEGDNLGIGTQLKIKLEIDALENNPVKGEVVQTYDLPEGIKAAGIKFLDLEDSFRDEIVGWIFEKQREMRKKGLL
ncbi:MAG: flagellar brake protein [Bacillota bacterium]